jgi:hypothetical protein
MMNTFQVISLVGGAGAPEGNEGSEGLPQLVRIGMFLCLLRYLLLKKKRFGAPSPHAAGKLGRGLPIRCYP